MNNYQRVCVIVEGMTELRFVEKVLLPYCAERGVYMVYHQVYKPGQRGGDVRFSRIKKEIVAALKAKDAPIVSTFVDYYGIKEWTGLNDVPPNASPECIAKLLNESARAAIQEELPEAAHRYIPFLAVHEFEALLFSDSAILAENLGVDKEKIDSVLAECGSPERINNSRETAPSKRITQWNEAYIKTLDGYKIASQIGIPKMREACPLFDEWLNQLGCRD